MGVILGPFAFRLGFLLDDVHPKSRQILSAFRARLRVIGDDFVAMGASHEAYYRKVRRESLAAVGRGVYIYFRADLAQR